MIMKKSFVLATLVAVLFTLILGCKKDEISGLPFEIYEGYFVKNSDIIDSIGSFCEFHDMASFDTVFEAAAINGKENFLKAADFDEHFVIAVIKKNGYNSYNLMINKIEPDTIDQLVINVDYEYVLLTPNTSWSQTGRSIALLTKLEHHTIRFFENGNLIKEIGN